MFLRKNLNDWKNSLNAFRTIVDARRDRFGKELEQQSGAVSDAELLSISTRVDQARAELERIRSEGDAVALATPEEAQLWQRVDSTGQRLANISSAKANSTKQKQQFLRGVMLWNLEQEYPERVWNMTKRVRKLEQLVIEGEKRKAKLQLARDSSPNKFSGFDQRIDAAEPRIDRLLIQADKALGLHQQYLAGLASEQFDQHKQRLTAYLTEAQFALASAYDQSALAQESP